MAPNSSPRVPSASILQHLIFASKCMVTLIGTSTSILRAPPPILGIAMAGTLIWENSVPAANAEWEVVFCSVNAKLRLELRISTFHFCKVFLVEVNPGVVGYSVWFDPKEDVCVQLYKMSTARSHQAEEKLGAKTPCTPLTKQCTPWLRAPSCTFCTIEALPCSFLTLTSKPLLSPGTQH